MVGAIGGGSGGTSLSDSSTTSSASGLNQGAKFSGMNITASRETPPFLTAILGKATGTAPAAGWMMPAALVAVAVVALVLIRRK